MIRRLRSIKHFSANQYEIVNLLHCNFCNTNYDPTGSTDNHHAPDCNADEVLLSTIGQVLKAMQGERKR